MTSILKLNQISKNVYIQPKFLAEVEVTLCATLSVEWVGGNTKKIFSPWILTNMKSSQLTKIKFYCIHQPIKVNFYKFFLQEIQIYLQSL